ncbi:ABC transporter substrate-binding protein [Hypericibacter sp.]|uniref:ABC transporter substrate-binding protein n=1 Tax=Hypericibacter sp. TaxID=2705401 RepID=UPI003D6C99D3
MGPIDKTVSRRQFGVGLAAATGVAALATSLPLRRALAATTTLTVVSYGGSYQEAQDKAMFTPFTQANSGIAIQQDSPSSAAKLKAMVEAGQVTWDIVDIDDSFGFDSDAQWLEPIDYTIIDRSQFIEGYAQNYRIGSDIEATVVTYRKDKFGSSVPNSFADFFDTKKFPGKRTIWKYAPGGVYEAALLADGVAPDKLYPIDVERAQKKLDTIKDDLIWWDTGAQSMQLLTSGEATMGLLWVGRALTAAQTAPVGVAWGQWTTQNGWWVVPKGTKNKKAAMEALKSFTSPESQIRFTEYLPYGPTNKLAVDKVAPTYKGNLPTDHLDTRVEVDAKWWNDNLAKVDPVFQEWLLK